MLPQYAAEISALLLHLRVSLRFAYATAYFFFPSAWSYCPGPLLMLEAEHRIQQSRTLFKQAVVQNEYI